MFLSVLIFVLQDAAKFSRLLSLTWEQVCVCVDWTATSLQ